MKTMTELDEQLQLLVQQYGVAEVRRRLNAIIGPRARSHLQRSARDYATGMNVRSSQKERLLTLARRFEEKRFLPTTSEIRNFFEAYGASPIKPKSRQNAIPSILRFLSSLSDEQLDRIIKDGSFGGPSELGPIADAIRAKSVSMRNAENAASSSSREEKDLDPLHRAGKADAYR